MPELPEVQTVVNTLAPAIVGRRIAAAAILRQDVIRPAGFDLGSHLRGQAIAAVGRRGKRIVFTLDSAQRFYIHLGMTGRLTLQPHAAPRAAHTHLIIDLGEAEVHFRDPRRFGGIWWLGPDSDPGGLGPEPLALRPDQLARRLERTRRALKPALLDQALIAGLGNIYVDESLFLAGLHPLRPANTLLPAEVRRLNRAIKLTLRRALRHRGSTLRDYVDANGGSGAFQKLHQVYDRAGLPCRSCRTPIQRIVVGGRSTHFCPACQPPRP